MKLLLILNDILKINISSSGTENVILGPHFWHQAKFDWHSCNAALEWRYATHDQTSVNKWR